MTPLPSTFDLQLTYDEVDTLYGSLAGVFIVFEEHRKKLRPLMKKMEDYLKENSYNDSPTK